MRKFAYLALLLVTLFGCTTPHSRYGNFTQNSPSAYNQKMADDAVKQLLTLYPPASTQFYLHQVTTDAFGTSLVELMRSKGYALLEFKPTLAGQHGNMPTAPGLPLRYIVDQAAGLDLYRVTLLIGNQSLTRAYLAQNGSVFPAGTWVRKE